MDSHRAAVITTFYLPGCEKAELLKSKDNTMIVELMNSFFINFVEVLSKHGGHGVRQ